MTANGELMFLQLNQGFMYCVNNQDIWESNICIEKGKNSCKYGEQIFLSCHGKRILPGNIASMASSWGHQMSPHQSATSLMCLLCFDSSSCSISSPLHFHLIPTLAASMENSEQVLSESCNSYRWLMRIKSSLDSLGDSHRSFDTQDGSSFIEVDPECISLRWAIDANGFGFDLPRSQSSDHILFSSGLLQLPVLDKSESLSSSRSLLSLPNHCRSISSSLISSTLFHSAHDTPSSRSLASRNAKLRHGAGCLKKVIWRYMCFLMHLCEKVKALRLTSSRSEKSCTNLAGSSRRTSDSCSSIECCHSYADISIHDAILHCKKSNEQDK